MNEELKKIKIYPKKDVNLDLTNVDKDETTAKFFTKDNLSSQNEEVAVGEAGGASFSQLGQAPTNPIAMVKVNGVPTAGKSTKKKKKIKEEMQITNFNDSFIYGVDIKQLNKYSYEVKFIGRKENSKELLPMVVARGIIMDDGEWLSIPEITEYIMDMNDEESKYNIKDRLDDFISSNNFNQITSIIKQKISKDDLNEQLTYEEIDPIERIINNVIETLDFKPIQGGLGYNYSKEGNYTHILSYNKYEGDDIVITVDYMIFDKNDIRFEKSWDLNSIQEAEAMQKEIFLEYESWE